jgi:hypothetical protein
MATPELLSRVTLAISELTSSVRANGRTVESTKRARVDVDGAPPARADIKRHFARIIEHRAEQHRETIARHVKSLKADDLTNTQQIERFGQVLAVPPLGGVGPTPASLDAALCLLLGEQIKVALDRVIDGMDWPDGSMPIAERAKRLAKIDSELDKLLEEERTLVAAARSAGVLIEEPVHGR